VVGRTLSHYLVEKRLGAGGMGEVFLALDLALGRRAAVKVLSSTLSPEARERLPREGEARSRLPRPEASRANASSGGTPRAHRVSRPGAMETESVCSESALPQVSFTL
jgi:serine/threonine protein kinase